MTNQPARRQTAWLCLVVLAALLVGGCAALTGSREKNVEGRPEPMPLAAIPGDENPRFFALNAITPYHDIVSADDAVREAVWDRLRERLADARRLGARSMRVDPWWSLIEPQPGRFEWEFTDRVIDEILAVGMEPLYILCYGAAWTEGRAPATVQEIEEFANYAAEAARRYRGKVRHWEVWNEPNTAEFWGPSANPAVYTDLLRRTYEALKETDPENLVIAMATAGADTHFMASCYDAGAAGSFDALSFHHYGSHKGEWELEGEIERVRELMKANGDGDKPVLITETGLSTGDSTVVDTSTPEEQARWVVKKHLLARAMGLHSLYYFKLRDDPPDSNPDGFWGLMNSTGGDKPSATAYQAMAERLADARFVGRAHRMAYNPMRRDDVEFHVYTRPENDEILAVAWIRDDGEPMLVPVPAREVVAVENMYGEELESIEPDQRRRSAMVPLDREPVYLRGLSRDVLALCAVRFDPPEAVVRPGGVRTVTASVWNPLDEPLNVRLDPFFWPRGIGDVEIEAGERAFTVPPGETASMPITIGLPVDAAPFDAEAIAFRDPRGVSYSLPLVYRPPFDLVLEAVPAGERMSMVARISGFDEYAPPAAGTIHWEGVAGGTREEFRDVGPGGVFGSTRMVQPVDSVTEVRVVVETDEGARREKSVGIMRIPCGEYHEEEFVQREPQLELTAADHLLTGEMDDSFRAALSLHADETHLYIRAEIHDSTPLSNPHTGTELWRGDGVELYLGLDGPASSRRFGPRDFQVGLSPGDGGDTPPMAWNWRPRGEAPELGGRAITDARVEASPIPGGYLLEAALPLDEFGVALLGSRWIGLAIHVNDGGGDGTSEPRAVLGWEASMEDWRDPSGWGIGFVECREGVSRRVPGAP